MGRHECRPTFVLRPRHTGDCPQEGASKNVELILGILIFLLAVFRLVLTVRIVYDLVQMFARGWKPKGVSLVAASFVYAVTDPPLRLLRRVIPPIRIGGAALDLAFLILFFGVTILINILGSIAA